MAQIICGLRKRESGEIISYNCPPEVPLLKSSLHQKSKNYVTYISMWLKENESGAKRQIASLNSINQKKSSVFYVPMWLIISVLSGKSSAG